MANQYEVSLSDGRSYTVTTDRHHDNHDDNSFRRHLLDIVKQSVSGVVSQTVVRFIFRGRR